MKAAKPRHTRGMIIKENHPLGNLNTFGIEAYARGYVEVSTEESLRELLSDNEILGGSHLILGQGSNILFTDDYEGTIIRMMIKGREIVARKEGKIFLKVMAGEVWDDLVAYCVAQGWGGLENLSLIPGQVGSSPIQNIGAYGTELETHVVSLEAFDKQKGKVTVFSHDDCQFSYRNSFFKSSGKDRFIITSVTFKLDEEPVINTRYGSVAQELEKIGVSNPTISDVREVVCSIRRSKLPDPDVLGNAGSFFKNPVVSLKSYQDLKANYPELVAYPAGKDMKLAAGWLIDKAGWKGFRQGDAGVHDKQALVLVNLGKATGREILKLAYAIRNSVEKKFGVTLEPEVNIM